MSKWASIKRDFALGSFILQFHSNADIGRTAGHWLLYSIVKCPFDARSQPIFVADETLNAIRVYTLRRVAPNRCSLHRLLCWITEIPAALRPTWNIFTTYIYTYHAKLAVVNNARADTDRWELKRKVPLISDLRLDWWNGYIQCLLYATCVLFKHICSNRRFLI